MQDAQNFDGTIISVLPDVPALEPAHAIHMPFMADGIASLDARAELIEREITAKRRVLVHCEEGCEPAPLVVAWFLKTRRGMSLDDAYALLQARRPIVQDRRRWLGVYNR